MVTKSSQLQTSTIKVSSIHIEVERLVADRFNGALSQRNLQHIRVCAFGDKRVGRVECRSSQNPFLTRQSDSNHSSQSHSASTMNDVVDCELTKSQFFAPDLVDHMFGGKISPALAEGILHQLLADGFVHVYKGQHEPTTAFLNPHSEAAMLALKAVSEDSMEYGCIHSDRASNTTETRNYRWEWPGFPNGPIDEVKMVKFLNIIADKALEVARNLDRASTWIAQNRFASSKDKHHAIPLVYESGHEDIRPDFMVLPIAAFSGEQLQNVDEAYINFTTMRLVGDLKNTNFRNGLAQVQRYIRRIKRAQPWLRFSTGMSIVYNKVALIRADGSGTERIEVNLDDGWGCLEFIRMLLGIIVADKEHFGHNSNVELSETRITCKVHEVARPTSENSTPSSSAMGSSRNIHATPSISASGATAPLNSAASSTRKRPRSQVEESENDTKDKRRTNGKAITVVVVSPSKIYERENKGILFSVGSIEGRGTTVCVVIDPKDQAKFLALKISWQDVAHVGAQQAVLEKIRCHGAFRHVVVPFE